MPLHLKRLKERGFNQAIELSRPITKSLKIPIDLHACTRIKSTLPQTLIAPNERKKNVRNAFHANDSLKGKYVVILDDVMTSGETINALCKQLKAQQVKRIDVWCCARAGSSDLFF
ncbi:MAG: phosphoribosyltransferase family protein [Pseudomonadota bacterium]|nr:hypothetical protein [Gammaproteobacteria bacterium]MBU1558242.1 hypothetical protein [Gammaproteobacteria bacterium]MBU1628473.1 hypothetical protein [Gammaproteobacteria bacterium]MBU1926908.1 hypothetical protein [Gammaproteobacteria bacterium]MBU2545735.1 hypothetical protein [Gammaproteobacteria bacterium]